MHRPIDVPLCSYDTADGRRRLSAVLDELTLTYSIVERAPDGRSRTVRRHVPSMREARAWAARRHRSVTLSRPVAR